MNDGRIMAADIQYYTNAGNAIDESVLVGKTCRLQYLVQHFLCLITLTPFLSSDLFLHYRWMDR